MKVIEHEEQISRAVEGGRLIEIIGLGRTVKGLMFKGVNVRKNARVPAGSGIGYTLTEVNEDETTLTIMYHRPGQVYQLVYSVHMPLIDAIDYFELEGCDG